MTKFCQDYFMSLEKLSAFLMTVVIINAANVRISVRKTGEGASDAAEW